MKAGIILVVSVFLALYGGMHYALYKKALPFAAGCRGSLLVVLGLLLAAPLLAELLKGAGRVKPATLVGRIGYTWMGFAFLFFCFSLGLDLLLLCARTSAALLGASAPGILQPASVWPVPLAAALALVATVHGFLSARQIRVEWVRISSHKLAGLSRPFRLVQISDLHLDLLSDRDHVQRLVETIASLRADVVVSTGDLVDMGPEPLRAFTEQLNQLKPDGGKFAVTGNHEAYLGPAKSLAVAEQAGFEMLAYRAVSVDGVIHIVGVDDPAVRNRITMDGPAERAALQQCPKEAFTVLLKHQPLVHRASVACFDLQLSGHTHGGQIFPFHWISRLAYPARTGLSPVGPETWLYVSRGTGTWGPPIRFLAPPELTVIDLEPDAALPTGPE